MLKDFVKQRYARWDTRHRPEIEAGPGELRGLEKYMLEKGDATPNVSGRQEMLEKSSTGTFR